MKMYSIVYKHVEAGQTILKFIVD